MMTALQRKRFYFPAWNACARVLDWVMVRGRLEGDLVVQRRFAGRWPEPAGPELLKVLDAAEGLARQEHRAVTAEDLRHGCNVVAAGVPSIAKMNNQGIDRAVALFRLLQAPEDLQAIMDWLHPGEAMRTSLAGWVRKLAPEAVLRAIAKNAFQTEDVDRLGPPELRWLARQVKGRRSHQSSVISHQSSAEGPF